MADILHASGRAALCKAPTHFTPLTVPDVTRLCLLLLPAAMPPLSAAMVANGFLPMPLHLGVANLIQDVDLVLQAVQSQQ